MSTQTLRDTPPDRTYEVIHAELGTLTVTGQIKLDEGWAIWHSAGRGVVRAFPADVVLDISLLG